METKNLFLILITIGVISMTSIVIYVIAYRAIKYRKPGSSILIGLSLIFFNLLLIDGTIYFLISRSKQDITNMMDKNIWMLIIPFLLGFVGTAYCILRKKVKNN